jgi:hypothetical protein
VSTANTVYADIFAAKNSLRSGPKSMFSQGIIFATGSQNINTFTASIFWVFHQFSKVDGEFNSMNIQRRNVSKERILILFSNTSDLFSIAVSKDFPQTILCHQI